MSNDTDSSRMPRAPLTTRVWHAVMHLLAQPLVWLVQLYRLTLSPFVGQHCRFTPTCSQYAIEALQVHGAVKGSVLAAQRLGRCHPWCEGGYDPVPPISAGQAANETGESRFPHDGKD